MRHHIVAESPLVPIGGVEVDRVDGAPHRGDLLLGDRQAQGALGLGQGDPEPPPGRELHPRRPEPGHPPAGVPADQRVVVDVAIIHRSCSTLRGRGRGEASGRSRTRSCWTIMVPMGRPRGKGPADFRRGQAGAVDRTRVRPDPSVSRSTVRRPPAGSALVVHESRSECQSRGPPSRARTERPPDGGQRPPGMGIAPMPAVPIPRPSGRSPHPVRRPRRCDHHDRSPTDRAIPRAAGQGLDLHR